MTTGLRPGVAEGFVDSGTSSRCRRVAALAVEISRLAGFSVAMQPMLELAAAQMQCPGGMTGEPPPVDVPPVDGV